MSAPAISIVLPVFNRLRHLCTAVESVRAQTFADWELIAVDDGSDTPTRTWLESQRDARVRVVVQAHCGNPGKVRNSGIALASGRYLAFLDSDDVWDPQYLATLLAVLQRNPASRWAYCKTRMIDSSGELLPEARFRSWLPYEGDVAIHVLRREASIATSSAILECSLAREAGGFDDTLRFAEHYDLWLRLSLRCPVRACAQPLVRIRTHEENYTRDSLSTAAGWCHFYEHVTARLQDSALRAACGEMRAIAALELARRQVANRDWFAGARSLLASVPLGVTHAGWWRSLALTTSPGSRSR